MKYLILLLALLPIKAEANKPIHKYTAEQMRALKPPLHPVRADTPANMPPLDLKGIGEGKLIGAPKSAKKVTFYRAPKNTPTLTPVAENMLPPFPELVIKFESLK